eukprot:Seg406.1 transcript_id=Seg406.1/GoldUCD/mRNA.D3Y31 product="Multiple PDZ domain protein" protein_id=Seg406.1/GoldUCD/D3Y31
MRKLGTFTTFKPDEVPKNENDNIGYNSTEPIKDFVETTICLKKEKTGLGISIIGGCDTHLGKVLVSSVTPKGAAGKDGRLESGDQILSVNGNDLREVTHDHSVQILRMAKNPVRLTVYRENIEKIFTNCSDPEQEFQVVVRKGINDNLGLGIYARKDGKGVFVTYITQGSLVEACGLIEQGDRILQCNGKDLRKANQQDAVSFFKNLFGEVRLLIGRSKKLEETIEALIQNMNEEIVIPPRGEVFKERKIRSRSDVTSVKTAGNNNNTKRRTITMNEKGEPGTGSMLELISNQPMGGINDHNNINFGFREDSPQIITIANNPDGQWNDTSNDSQLKSTLKKLGKKGAKRVDHVSFEMTQIQQPRNSALMYGDATGV